MTRIPTSEITPEGLFWQRRRLLTLPVLAAGSAALAACAATPPQAAAPTAHPLPGAGTLSASTDELDNPLTDEATVIGYNNYYEFTTDKERVADVARGFVTHPWTVTVDGMVAKPRTYGYEDLLALPSSERIYRLRCVEGWSMVVPWYGFPLHTLLTAVEPTSSATYVRFETLHDVSRMPGQSETWYQWPYVEGLRLDEAMHDLTILATGVYGKALPPQNGAPLRLVVPWKYGFKSIKAIVRITLTDVQPTSLWMAAAPDEYGFYANVNPRVDHPRWSQADERRIGESGRRPTLPFNGYAKEVASLYTGMDLRKFY